MPRDPNIFKKVTRPRKGEIHNTEKTQYLFEVVGKSRCIVSKEKVQKKDQKKKMISDEDWSRKKRGATKKK